MVVHPKGYGNFDGRMIDYVLNLRYSVRYSSTNALQAIRNMDMGLKKEAGARARELWHL